MTSKRRGWLLLAVGWLLALTATAGRADEPPPWHPCRLREWPGRLFYGNGGPPHTFEQAGHPEEISCLAHVSNTHRYFGYYVGGGVLRKGEELGPTQGTWGWDYGGLFGHLGNNIVLLWNPARVQSGFGKYQIDGPAFPPDVGPYVEKIKEGPKAIHEMKGHD
jgi:hypothetical protein